MSLDVSLKCLYFSVRGCGCVYCLLCRGLRIFCRVGCSLAGILSARLHPRPLLCYVLRSNTNARGQYSNAGDFGDFGVSFVATVAGRYTRRGGPRLSVQGEPLLVPTRDNHEVPPMQRRPTVGPGPPGAHQSTSFRARIA